MIINVKNEKDKDIMQDILWMIGFDVFNKIDIQVSDAVEYHSIYNKAINTILKLQPRHLFRQDLFLYSPLAPSNNNYLQQGRWGNPFTPKTTVKYQKNISNHIKNIEWIIPHDNKYIDTSFTFWFQRDNRDANNYFKVILDICEDILYNNDKRTIPLTNNVFISGEDENQLMQVSMSNKIGVFTSLLDLQMFLQSNCNKCKKGQYNRKCPQLYNYLENRLPQGFHSNRVCDLKIDLK